MKNETNIIPNQNVNQNNYYDLAIIIPVFNEENNVLNLLNQVIHDLKSNINYQLIVINDGSSDNSINKILEFEKTCTIAFQLIDNNQNLGKSTSVIKGIMASNSNYIVIQDADLEYSPIDINYLYQEVSEKNYDVALGNRFGQFNNIIHWYGFYGNIALSFVFNLFSIGRIKTIITDMHVCYKMIRTDVAKDIVNNLNIQDSFALDTIILCKLTKYKLNNKNLKFIILPVFYNPRLISEGKKLNPVKDGLKCLFYIFKYNLF
jgi:glycosyltransferase involved in cell wall biosynthesis